MELGQSILRLWQKMETMPAGKRVFSWLLGRRVPYTGSIGAKVKALAPGHCEVHLKERRAVRNHLKSIHAVAITNLGEFASGLAFLTTFQPGMRSIVTELHTEYLKKGRGTLIATANAEPPNPHADEERWVEAEIKDLEGDVVARVRARWRVGQRPEKQ